MAGEARRALARNLPPIVRWYAAAPVHRVVRGPRGRRRNGLQRCTAHAWWHDGLHDAVHGHEPVLVRIVPELAERILLRGPARADVDLVAAAGLRPIEAGGGVHAGNRGIDRSGRQRPL